MKGLLVYDVPQKNKRLYYRIRKALWGVAAPVNLSVYAIDWGMRDKIQAVIDGAREETGQTCTASFVGIEPASEEELGRVVHSSLKTLLVDMGVRLQHRIDDALAENDFVSAAYIKSVEKKLDGVKKMALMFNITQDIDDACMAIQSMWKTDDYLIEKGIPVDRIHGWQTEIRQAIERGRGRPKIDERHQTLFDNTPAPEATAPALETISG